MLIEHKFTHLQGHIETDTVEMLCVAKPKYADVHLCIRAGMNMPIADIQLFDDDLFKSKQDSFPGAQAMGEEIVRRWNAHAKLLAAITEVYETELGELGSTGSMAPCEHALGQLFDLVGLPERG